MSERDDQSDATWVNLGALWRPDDKTKKYKLSASLDAGALLLAAHHAIANGEVKVRAFVFPNDDKKERGPDFRMSVAFEKPDRSGGGDGGDDGDGGGDDQDFG